MVACKYEPHGGILWILIQYAMVCQVGSISLADAAIDGRLDLVVAGHSIAEDDAIPFSNHDLVFFPFCTFFNLFGAIFLLDGERPELLDWEGCRLFNWKDSNRLSGKDLNLLIKKESGCSNTKDLQCFNGRYLKLLGKDLNCLIR